MPRHSKCAIHPLSTMLSAHFYSTISSLSYRPFVSSIWDDACCGLGHRIYISISVFILSVLRALWMHGLKPPSLQLETHTDRWSGAFCAVSLLGREYFFHSPLSSDNICPCTGRLYAEQRRSLEIQEDIGSVCQWCLALTTDCNFAEPIN